MAEAPKLRIAARAAPQISVRGNERAGEGLNSVAAALSRVTAPIEDRLDQIAESEGDKAGGLAGLTPEFRPTGDPSIRGRAYDRAGLRTALARLEAEQSAQADSLALKFQDDPAALSAAFDAAANTARAKLGPGLDAIAPDLQIGWERMKRAALSQASLRAEARMREADKAAAIAQIDARTKRIEQLAFASGNDRLAAEAVQGELAGLQALLLEHGPRGAFEYGGAQYAADDGRGGSLGLDDIQQLMLRAADTAMEARVKGRFALTRGSGAMQKFRDGFMADFKAGKVPLALDQVERLANGMDADIAHARALESAATEGLRSQVRDTIDLLKKGFKPQMDLDVLETSARMTGNAALIQNIGQARALYEFQEKAKRLPPAALDAFLGQERARLNESGASVFEADRFELAQSLRDNMRAGLQRDPLAWAAESAGRPLPALDFRDDKTLAASLKARAPAAEAIAKDYGVAPRYFTESESRMLSAALANASADGRMQILSALTRGVGDAVVPRVIAEVAKDSPALGQAALLMRDGNASAASRISAGVDIRREAGGEKLTEQMRNLAQPMLSALPVGMAEARGALLDAASAIYAADAANRGVDTFDADLFGRALEEAAGARFNGSKKLSGGFGWVNGASVVLPSDMTEDYFSGLLSNIRDADLDKIGEMDAPPLYADGKKVPADVLRDAYPVTVGNGLYAFSLTDPASGSLELLGAKNGRGYFVLETKKLWRATHGRPASVPDFQPRDGLWVP